MRKNLCLVYDDTKLSDIDTIYTDLYKLYTIRDQAEKAESFLKKVKEPENIIYFF